MKIKTQAEKLIRDLKELKITDKEFHVRERSLIQDNSHELIVYANDVRFSEIEALIEKQIESIEDAIEKRYVITPLIYRIGLSSKGAELQQETFKYLFPKLNMQIGKKIEELYGDINKAYEKVLENFSYLQTDQVWNFASRVKSNHSIWKKAGSINFISDSGVDAFSTKIHDLIGLTYEMKIPDGGNRFDSLLSGLSMVQFDKKKFKEYKNQYIEAKGSDFELEPIIKFKSVVDNVPVDLQIHGGLIFGFMASSVYYVYKGFDFDKVKNKLSKKQWYRRLGRSIDLYEDGNGDELSRMLLDEVKQKPVDYGSNSYRVPSEPLLEEYRNLTIPGTELLAIKCSNHVYSEFER